MLQATVFPTSIKPGDAEMKVTLLGKESVIVKLVAVEGPALLIASV